MKKAPVVMVGYTRAATLVKSLKRLSMCKGVEGRPLRLYLDFAVRESDCRKCEEMYEVARAIQKTELPWLEIIRRTRNYGVPGNLLGAIRENLDQYGRVIFFEDDVCVASTFLSYMDEALERYSSDPRIFCVNGYQIPYLRIPKSYQHDVYLSPRNSAWGFGIWKDRWDAVDFGMRDWHDFCSRQENRDILAKAGCDVPRLVEAQLAGRVHTWDVQCTYHMAKNGLYAIEPRKSLSKNIGFGVEAVHCQSRDSSISHQRYYDFSPRLVDGLLPDDRIISQFKYALCDPRFVHRVLRKLMRIKWGMFGRHDESTVP